MASLLFRWHIAFSLVAVPFVYYFILWTRPKLWMQFCRRLKRDPCQAMFEVAAVGKFLQFSAFGAWYFSAAPPITISGVLSLPFWRVLGGLLAVTGGQVLNAGAFRAIGKDGIFYGCRFGKTVPWCTTWPFGGPLAVSHPQYCGASLTVLGALAILATPGHVQAGIVHLCLGWLGCYAAAALWEDHL